MSRLAALARAAEATSSTIRTAMLTHIVAMVVIVVTLLVGQERLQQARESDQAIEPARKVVNEQVPMLEKAWQYDKIVIGNDAYPEVLDRVTQLLLVETFFIGYVQLLFENKQDFEPAKSEKVATMIGDLAQRVNRLRQALPELSHATRQGRGVVDMSLSQLNSYAEYLSFHEYFADGGPGKANWTQICKIAALIRYMYEDENIPDNFVTRIVRSEVGSAALKWADDQLVRQSDAPGDFTSALELAGTAESGANVLELLELAGEAQSFRTPRDEAIGHVFGFEDQTEVQAQPLLDIMKHLNDFGLGGIPAMKAEARSRLERVESLENERVIALPFGSLEIPQRHAWGLAIVGAVMLGHLFRLRRRLFSFVDELRKDPELWTTTMDVMPYRVTPEFSAGFWVWQLHHDALGLFGLFMAMVAILSFPSLVGVTGWIWLALAYVIAVVLTLYFWSRFRCGHEPHALSKFAAWDAARQSTTTT